MSVSAPAALKARPSRTIRSTSVVGAGVNRASSASTSSIRSSRKNRTPSLLSQWATAYHMPLAKTMA